MFLEIKDLTFHYKKENEATLKDVSLSIQKGEILSILGSSGSGKSTLLRLIAGLEIPSSGSITINEKVIASSTHFVLPEKRGVGMVFQDYALFPHMNVVQNIQYGLRRLNRSQKEQRVEELVELTGLADLKKRYPYELSGGQQQRVALARAIAPNPSLVLLDEPFSNLDTDLRIKIREELAVILRKTMMTTVFVTHDLEDVSILADRIVIMKSGNIVPQEKIDNKVALFSRSK